MDRTKRNRRTALVGAVALAGAAIVITGCGSSSSSSSSPSTGSGSSFAALANQTWCKNSGLCTYISKGSGAGITDFTNGVVDWADTDSPLKPAQLSALASARGGVTPVYFPTLLGAIGVPTNVTGATGLQFSGAVLADIFDGVITRWNDPKIAAENPGATLPNAAITVCVRSDGSGTSSNFSGYLGTESATFLTKVGKASQTPSWTAPVKIASPQNAGVLQCVKSNTNTIGYNDLATVITSGDQNLLAKIQAPDGTYVTPTSATTSAAGTTAVVSQPIVPKTLQKSLLNSSGAGAYPITITTFVLGYSNYTQAGKASSLPKVKAFLNYLYSSKAQSALAALGYAPLPSVILNAGTAQVSTLK
jgi:phosphate transport system substrate-binding protein